MHIKKSFLIIVAFSLLCFKSFSQQREANKTYSSMKHIAANYSNDTPKLAYRILSGVSISLSDNSFAFNVDEFFQFKPKWGIGFSIRMLTCQINTPVHNSNDTISFFSMPICLSGKYFPISFLNHAIQPYFKTSVGFNVIKSEGNRGTLNFENGIGIQVGLFNQFFLTLGVSQLNQKIRSNIIRENGSSVSYNFWYNDLVAEIGILINALY